MKLRKNILPRRALDALRLLGEACVLIPIGMINEMINILPIFHEPGGFWHSFTLVVQIILLFNIESNLIMGMLIDNSVDFETLTPPADALSLGWHHCTHCDKLAPPRSWHCEICDACILKRDHHCTVLSNCVGLRNHRYFILFVTYLLIGSTYPFVYQSIYFWILQGSSYLNWMTPVKLFFPPLMLWYGSLWTNVMLIFYFLNAYAVVISWSLFFYHFPLCLRGNVSHERGQGNIYDMGWRKNFREIFGERMCLAVLWPFVASKLPNEEGIEWQTNRDSIV